MYKFLQVHEGDQTYRFRGTNLNILVLSVNIHKATVRIEVDLVKKNANATITGIIIGKGTDAITINTLQVHESPETNSDLLIKTVLRDKAMCIYHGGIVVKKRAQKTNAYQRNENLFLEGRPYAESKPLLEILANDVRCTHGSTTGPINKQELWYLEARGIPQETGKRLIAMGFIKSALMRFNDESIMRRLWPTLSL